MRRTLDTLCLCATAALVLSAAVLLASCQPAETTKVSLSEAKTLVASFKELPSAPPPRSVTDVLNNFGPEQPIPGDCAARRVALSPEVVEWDGRSDKRVGSTLARRHMQIAASQFFHGNYQNSIRFATVAAANNSEEYAVSQAQMYFALARFQALVGNFDGAKTARAAGWRRARYRGTFRGSEIQQDSIRAHAMMAEGAMAQMTGRYQEAEALYRKVYQQYHHGLRAYMNLQMLESDLAEVLANRGRPAEAEAEARKALKYIYVYSTPTAYYLLRLAQIIYAQGRYEDAERLVRRVINIYEALCTARSSINFALARQRLAEVLAAQGRWEEALAAFQAIERTVASADRKTFDRLFRGNVDWGLALLNTGRSTEATVWLRDAHTRLQSRFGAGHRATVEARGMLATAYARTGEREQALTEFEAVIPVLAARLQARTGEGHQLTTSERRAVQIIEAYVELLADISNTPTSSKRMPNAVGEAFRVVQLAQGRSVLRALSASSARAASRDPQLAELAGQEQDARRQFAALGSRFAYQVSLPEDEQGSDVIADLRQRLASAEAARDALSAELSRSFPKYANLVNPRSLSITDAQAALGEQEALLVIHTSPRRTFVWAVPKRGVAAFAMTELGSAEAGRLVERLREALDPSSNYLGEIPAFDLEVAYTLYDSLLRPVEAGWRRAAHLRVVASGPLAQLPLSLLPTSRVRLEAERPPLFSNYREVPWLLRSHAVTALPAVASLTVLSGGSAQRRASEPFAGFGDPWFSPEQAVAARSGSKVGLAISQAEDAMDVRGLRVRRRSVPDTRSIDSAELAKLPRLPETAEELRSIALALGANPDTDVFLGDMATEANVKGRDFSSKRVLAFATHGLVPGDLDGLTQPALALSSPAVGGGSNDGVLTMGEILGLRFNAEWVVLSACNTAAAHGAGAEAISGLGRAFFYAGTRALLVSNWPVETTSAKELITDIFRRQRRDPALSRAEALRESMLALIDGPGYSSDKTDETLFSYAHPIFWAPFSLFGDGGGRN